MTGNASPSVMPKLDGPCREVDPELFFAHHNSHDIKTAVAICQPCPSRQPCLEWALNNPQSGVLGGLTEKQRRDLLRQRGRSYRVAGQRWAS